MSVVSRLRFVAAAIGASIAASLALASSGTAQDYPSKPITIFVGYGAGGGTDVVVRAIAEPLSQELGQPILVQNVPGAGGGVAAARVAKAPADGYTILATTSSTFTLEPLLRKMPYEPNDFRHISVLATFQGAMFTRADKPFDNFKELIAHAKKEGRPIPYASFFQLDRLVMDYIGRKEGVQFVPVPVEGGNGALQAVLAGTVDLAYSGGTWGPHVDSGQIKLLFTTSLEPLEMKPDLTTMKELGYDVGTGSHLVLSVPAGTPDNVAAKLSQAIRKVAGNPLVRKVGTERYMPIVASPPDQANAIIGDERKSLQTMMDAVK